MDPTLYRAAMEGKIGVLVENKEQLNVQATSLNKNTVLHVAAQFGQTNCAVLILKLCPSLLRRKNNQGETPLHIAAREGHSIIVIALICCAKLANDEDPGSGGNYKVMLWMLNEDEDAALHEAVRNNHVSVVELLIKEDPEFVYSANKSAETPLYIAAERGYNHIVSKILEICKAPAYSGPGGRTALHAAAIGRHSGSVEELLKWNQTLAWKVDDYGWTPLHCAARINNVSGVIQLLKMDKSLAYIATANNDENKTALHIAVSKGYVSIMKELLSYCPDCWETVNARGQNILHIAVENEKTEVIEYIVKNSWVNHLLNQKDVDGNTPLHMLAASDCSAYKHIIRHPRVDKGAFNKKNITPLHVSISIDRFREYEDGINHELTKAHAPWSWRNIVREDIDNMEKWKKALAEDKKEIREDIIKKGDNQLIVAALIATVTFAAGFTLPGGYNNDGPDQGMAILSRKSAFKAFMVTDTIAVVFSISAVFLSFVGSLYNIQKKIVHRYSIGLWFVIIALAAMAIAFVTGTYAVLGNSLGLAIAVCVIGCFAFLVYYLEFRKPCQSMFRNVH